MSISRRISGLFAHFLGRQEVLTFVLAFLTIESVILSVEVAHWVTPMPSLLGVSIEALVLGFLVARVRRWALLYHLAALVAGAAYLLIVTAGLIEAGTLTERIAAVVTRTQQWVSIIASGGASTDRIPIALFLCILAWLMSYATMYIAIRRPSVWALVPTGVVLISNLTYLPPDYAPWLFAYLLTAVLLLANMLYRNRLAQWERQGVQSRGVLGLHVLHYAFWFAVLVFGVSFFVPHISAGPGPVRETWNRLRSPLTGAEDGFNRVLSAVPAKKDLGVYGFGSAMPFRGEIRFSENPAFLVSSPVGVYWRGRSYDHYESWGWTNSEGLKSIDSSASGDIVPLPSYRARQDTTVVISPQMDTRRLVFPGEPLKVSVPVTALARAGAAGAAPPEIVDLQSRDFVGPGKSYQVQALVPNVSERQLRNDAGPYPRWAQDRYLALPDSLPTRVRNLARQLTADKQSRFDKIMAIVNHARSLGYTQLVPAPQANDDGVDYFLFKAKEGYSDYHASAAAVLLRAAGIPARVVAGYLPGTFDLEKRVYVVKEADSHAWTEVYFPTYGWVSFEATGGGPALVAPLPSPLNRGVGVTEEPDTEPIPTPNGALIFGGEDDIPVEDGGDLPPLENDWGRGIPGILMFIGGFALGALVVTQVAVRLLARVRSPRSAYLWLRRIGRLIGYRPHRYETAYEYGQRLQGLVPGYASRIHDIVHRYSLVTYARRRVDEPLAPLPWGRLMWALLRVRIGRSQGRTQQASSSRRPAYGV